MNTILSNVLSGIPAFIIVCIEQLLHAFRCWISLISLLHFNSKIPHLLELGVNAVELQPVFEFDEFEFQRRPNPRDHMVIKTVSHVHAVN